MAEQEAAPMDRVRLQIPSHPRYVGFTRDTVYRLALQNGLSMGAAFDLKIVTGEALANIIKHAYDGKSDKPVFIEILMYQSYLELRFRDLGRQIPITSSHARDLSDYRERGLGVFLISQLSDYHYYDQSRNVGTELVIKKRLQ
ncbi:MAG: ATP-binding protein [Leptospirales bacterium]